MHTTELDTTLNRTLDQARSAGLTLVIANKNYSSWSMRPWLVLSAFSIPFHEVAILLGQDETANRIAEFSSAGRVPVLLAGDITIWDSLAICEYLAEQFPEKNLWPQDVAARAMARCICAEMHSGFGGLRSAMSMNIRMSFPGKGRSAEAQADIGRICEIWEDCLSRFGHHQFLFGEFSIADAYFAPVCMRLKAYGLPVPAHIAAYADRVRALPGVQAWITEALAEKDFVNFDEPYRLNPYL